MADKPTKLEKRMKDLEEFLLLPQAERINVLQAALLEKSIDKEVTAKNLSALARAYFESTGIQKEDPFKFDSVSPDSLREPAGDTGGKRVKKSPVKRVTRKKKESP